MSQSEYSIEGLKEFVAAHAAATLGHDPRWIGVMTDGLGHRDVSQVIRRDGVVVGWLPLVVTSSWLFGRHVVSLPYVNEAGVLAEDQSVATELLDRAAEIAKSCNARFVELRHHTPVEYDGLTPVRTDKVRMTRTLPNTTDQLPGAIISNNRNRVKKARSHGLTVKFGGSELVDAFYRIFAVNMRDLGTPVFPRSLFTAITHHFGNDADIAIVQSGDEPAACGLLMHGRDVTEVPSASCLRAFNPVCANMLLYYHLLERAIERGSSVFDFGRSTIDSNTYAFKKQWGGSPEPTGWQHLPLSAKAKPITKEDEKFTLAKKVWQRLPVWLTRVVGPPIVRGIP
jgi:FemAB-related protein (PEP-CTERM system-associated)